MTLRRPTSWIAALALATAAALASGWAGAAGAAASNGTAAESPDTSADAVARRPRVGLVLSGGGARGLAHVGVLKALEAQRISIDVVVGTSMGAIIGGLYASGMSAAQIERELALVRWDEVFSTRVGRRDLSQRRKDQDHELSAVLEFGLRDGELKLPQSAVAGTGLEALLRRYTLPVRQARSFDHLPLPFRAVATDMETGAPVVLADGDLAQALRSSMSVPGVFSPIERDGRILGDGGLVDNLPVNLARQLGAEVVIAVNVGTPVGGRETLNSAVGLTAQMINILTEQNVQRSLALLRPGDVLIRPELGGLGSGDFDRVADFIARGAAAGQASAPALAALAVGAEDYASWARRHTAPALRPQALTAVGFVGTKTTRPARLAPLLESRAGQPFDPGAAARDTLRLAASGDYLRADYRLLPQLDGEALVFQLEDKPWGPHYLRLGLDLATDFSARAQFNLKLAHERRWLTDAGTEWRNRLNLGSDPMLATELYHPLRFAESLERDWFVSGWAQVERRRLGQYDSAGREAAVFDRYAGRIGVDLGRPWARRGEMRLGLVHDALWTRPVLLGASYDGPVEATITHEFGPRLRVVDDQLDYALFPQSGYRIEAEAAVGRRMGAFDEVFHRVQASGTLALSQGRHTLNLHLQAIASDEGGSPLVGRYTLGGFHQLSGFRPGQLSGNHVLFARATWYARLKRDVVLTRGFFAGASLEAGNAWVNHRDISLRGLLVGSSVFLGADTGVGPMYLGLTWAARGALGLVFFIGRP
jgi:NTE family protein